MRGTVAGAWTESAFADGVSQVASKSILREISAAGGAAGGGWTFSEPDICTRAAALSYMTGALSIGAGGGRGAHDFLSSPALRLARLWEDLWKLGEKTPRGYALLNAACAYELAGYQANAACLSRVFEREKGREDGVEPDVQDLASMFLQRRFVALRGACARLVAEPDYDAADNIEYRLGAAAAASALSRLASSFLSGATDGIGAAAADLSTAGRVFYQHGYYQESTLLHSLRSLAAPMSSRSTWSILGDRARSQFAWNRYLLLLGRGLGAPVPECRSVSEMWPSQRDAVDGGLLESDASKIVRMPTSSGKTRIAEMAMLKALTSGAEGAAPAKCVYVAPHGALVSEAAETISAVFADLGFSVSGVDGAYDGALSEEGGAAPGADIMVMTPEKLDLLLRARRGRLEGVGLFIFDEGHIIGDGARGMKMEILLTRLKRRFGRARFMLLSAVISTETMREFSEWLSGSGDNVIETEWRPTRQRRSRFEWSRIGGGGGDRECTLVFDREGADGRPIRADAVIKRRQYRHCNQMTGRVVRPSFPSAEKSETAAELAFKYSGLGPVLVYAATKRSALAAAKKLAYRLELTARAEEEEVPSRFSRPAGAAPPRSQALASEWLGPGHEVSRLLGSGIAVHTGDMPDVLRRAVEEDMRRGRYAVIVATNTLSQGVDIPIRTVIIHSCRRYDPDTKTQWRIPDHEYWNLAGRAGRAGHETEGTVIHIVKTAADREDYGHYGRHRAYGNIRSRICGLLLDLVQGRISDGAAEEALDPEVLGMLAEEGTRGSCEDMIGDVVSGSLGARQALNGAGAGIDAGAGLERLRGRFLAVAGRAARLDDGTALAYGRTGMSTQSCETLGSYVDGNRSEVARLLLSSGADGDAVDLVLLALDAADGLPEMRGGEQHGGDRESLVRLWMGGSDVSEVCRGVEAADRGAAMLFIERYLGRTAPWGISSFIRIAACRAGIAEADLPAAVRHLPDMVRYGVPSAEAAWAMRLGVTTRRAAMGVAEGCPGGLSFGEFAEWLAGQGVGDLAEMCGPDAPLADIAAALSRMRPNPLIRRGAGLDEVLAMRPSVACAGASGRRAAASCAAGDPLEARRDHDAAADRNAIAVHSADGLIGLVERDVAQYLAPLIDCGVLRLRASFDGPGEGEGGEASVRIRLRRAGGQ